MSNSPFNRFNLKNANFIANALVNKEFTKTYTEENSCVPSGDKKPKDRTKIKKSRKQKRK